MRELIVEDREFMPGDMFVAQVASVQFLLLPTSKEMSPFALPLLR